MQWLSMTMLEEHLFAEEGFGDNIETDPYEVSTPENIKNNL